MEAITRRIVIQLPPRFANIAYYDQIITSDMRKTHI
jgi:hypothetical protein